MRVKYIGKYLSLENVTRGIRYQIQTTIRTILFRTRIVPIGSKIGLSLNGIENLFSNWKIRTYILALNEIACYLNHHPISI